MRASPRSILPLLATLLLALAMIGAGVPAWAEPRIVAAENFYGDVARQIAGPEALVTAILTNPEQDPHLFEASPSVGRAVSAADVVIMSGLGYDPWMASLVKAARGGERVVIVAAELAGRRAGDNPHIWYDPQVMRLVAARLADVLARRDGAEAPAVQQRLAAFERGLAPVDARIAALRLRFAGRAVTATEPVFGAMFAALGMVERNAGFQRAVMNDTEPSASDIAGFETDLRTGAVAVLVFNSQVSNPIALRMERLARASGVPVLGVTETMPAGQSYQGWMLQTLDALDHAMAH